MAADATFYFDTNINQVVGEIGTGLQKIAQLQSANEQASGAPSQDAARTRALAEYNVVLQKAIDSVGRLNRVAKETPDALPAKNLRAGIQTIVTNADKELGRLTARRGLSLEAGLELRKGAIGQLIALANREAKAASIQLDVAVVGTRKIASQKSDFTQGNALGERQQIKADERNNRKRQVAGERAATAAAAGATAEEQIAADAAATAESAGRRRREALKQEKLQQRLTGILEDTVSAAEKAQKAAVAARDKELDDYMAKNFYAPVEPPPPPTPTAAQTAQRARAEKTRADNYAAEKAKRDRRDQKYAADLAKMGLTEDDVLAAAAEDARERSIAKAKRANKASGRAQGRKQETPEAEAPATDTTPAGDAARAAALARIQERAAASQEIAARTNADAAARAATQSATSAGDLARAAALARVEERVTASRAASDQQQADASARAAAARDRIAENLRRDAEATQKQATADSVAAAQAAGIAAAQAAVNGEKFPPTQRREEINRRRKNGLLSRTDDELDRTGSGSGSGGGGGRGNSTAFGFMDPDDSRARASQIATDNFENQRNRLLYEAAQRLAARYEKQGKFFAPELFPDKVIAEFLRGASGPGPNNEAFTKGGTSRTGGFEEGVARAGKFLQDSRFGETQIFEQNRGGAFSLPQGSEEFRRAQEVIGAELAKEALALKNNNGQYEAELNERKLYNRQLSEELGKSLRLGRKQGEKFAPDVFDQGQGLVSDQRDGRLSFLQRTGRKEENRFRPIEPGSGEEIDALAKYTENLSRQSKAKGKSPQEYYGAIAEREEREAKEQAIRDETADRAQVLANRKNLDRVEEQRQKVADRLEVAQKQHDNRAVLEQQAYLNRLDVERVRVQNRLEAAERVANERQERRIIAAFDREVKKFDAAKANQPRVQDTERLTAGAKPGQRFPEGVVETSANEVVDTRNLRGRGLEYYKQAADKLYDEVTTRDEVTKAQIKYGQILATETEAEVARANAARLSDPNRKGGLTRGAVAYSSSGIANIIDTEEDGVRKRIVELYKRIGDGFHELEIGSAAYNKELTSFERSGKGGRGKLGSFVHGLTSGGFGGSGQDGIEGILQAAGTTAKYSALYSVLGGFQNLLAQVGTEMVNFADSNTDLSIALKTATGDVSDANAVGQDYVNTLENISIAAGSNVGDVQDIAAAGIRTIGLSASYSKEELSQLGAEFAEQAQRMAVLGKTNITDAAGNLRAITSAFDVPLQNSSRINDALVVGKNVGGGSEKDTAQAVATAGESLKSAGFSLEQAFTLASRIQAATDQSGAVVGNKLSRIVSIVSGSAGQKALSNLNESLTPQQLDIAPKVNLGADVQTQIAQLSTLYEKAGLSQQQIKPLTNALGGTSSAKELITTLESYDSLLKDLDGNQKQAGAAAKEYQERLDDLSQTVREFKGAISAIIVNIGNSGALDGVLVAFKVITDLLKGFAYLTGYVDAIGNGFSRITSYVVEAGLAIAVLSKVLAAGGPNAFLLSLEKTFRPQASNARDLIAQRAAAKAAEAEVGAVAGATATGAATEVGAAVTAAGTAAAEAVATGATAAASVAAEEIGTVIAGASKSAAAGAATTAEAAAATVAAEVRAAGAAAATSAAEAAVAGGAASGAAGAAAGTVAKTGAKGLIAGAGGIGAALLAPEVVIPAIIGVVALGEIKSRAATVSDAMRGATRSLRDYAKVLDDNKLPGVTKEQQIENLKNSASKSASARETLEKARSGLNSPFASAQNEAQIRSLKQAEDDATAAAALLQDKVTKQKDASAAAAAAAGAFGEASVRTASQVTGALSDLKDAGDSAEQRLQKLLIAIGQIPDKPGKGTTGKTASTTSTASRSDLAAGAARSVTLTDPSKSTATVVPKITLVVPSLAPNLSTTPAKTASVTDNQPQRTTPTFTTPATDEQVQRNPRGVLNPIDVQPQRIGTVTAVPSAIEIKPTATTPVSLLQSPLSLSAALNKKANAVPTLTLKAETKPTVTAPAPLPDLSTADAIKALSISPTTPGAAASTKAVQDKLKTQDATAAALGKDPVGDFLKSQSGNVNALVKASLPKKKKGEAYTSSEIDKAGLAVQTQLTSDYIAIYNAMTPDQRANAANNPETIGKNAYDQVVAYLKGTISGGANAAPTVKRPKVNTETAKANIEGIISANNDIISAQDGNTTAQIKTGKAELKQIDTEIANVKPGENLAGLLELRSGVYREIVRREVAQGEAVRKAAQSKATSEKDIKAIGEKFFADAVAKSAAANDEDGLIALFNEANTAEINEARGVLVKKLAQDQAKAAGEAARNKAIDAARAAVEASNKAANFGYESTLTPAQRALAKETKTTEAGKAVKQDKKNLKTFDNALDASTPDTEGGGSIATGEDSSGLTALERRQKKTELEIAKRDANAQPGAKLDEAKRAVKNAQDRFDDYKVKNKDYYDALKVLNDAKYAESLAEQDYANNAALLKIDTTDPVAVAEQAVKDAKARQADAKKSADKKGLKGKARADFLDPFELDVRTKEASAESTATSEYLSNAQTSLRLGRISHTTYMALLRAKRDQLLVEYNSMAKDAQGQAARKKAIDGITGDLKSAASELDGQFNLGDIKIPTVYQVRRSIKAKTAGDVLGSNGARSTAGNVVNDSSQQNLVLNGVPIEQVVTILKNMFGLKARTTTGKKRK